MGALSKYLDRRPNTAAIPGTMGRRSNTAAIPGTMDLRLKAATILETMVAMVILVVVFGIGVTLFIRVGSGSISLKRLEAAQLLQDFSETTRLQGEFVDADQRVNGFTEKRRVTEMNDLHTLWRIHYYIYDRNGQLLLEWQQLVLGTTSPAQQ